MKKIQYVTVLLILLCLVSYTYAGERYEQRIDDHARLRDQRQEQRIEELEHDNVRLLNEIARLRNELHQWDARWTNRRQCGSGNTLYNYDNGGISGTARQLEELNRLKRSWENLQR